VTKVIQKPKVV